MVARTVASFVAYKSDAAGDGVPLIARGAPGTVYLAAEDGTISGTSVDVVDTKTGLPATPLANIHGVVGGFKVNAPDTCPGVYFVSGALETEMQRFLEGSRGEPGLPGPGAVPADEAVGTYLSTPGTDTNSESKQVTRSVLAAELDTRNADLVAADTGTKAAVSGLVTTRMAEPVDALSYLSNIEVICKFSMYKDDGVTADRGYIQGISVNEEDDELYCVFGGGTAGWQRFEVRRLSTGAPISEHKVTSENAYTQGMPWFKNGSGDLCFVVFLKAAPIGGGGSYQIYNYTTNTVGPDIPLASRAHGDRCGDFFLIAGTGGTAPATTLNRFYLYTWESIKAGAPVLVKNIPVSNPGYTAAKHQAETINGQYFFTHGGQPWGSGGLPTITAYDFTGQLKGIIQHKAEDLMAAININKPGTLVIRPLNPDWEAEGITNANGRLYTTHVFGNVAEQTHAFGQFIRTVVILRHNNPTGTLVPTKPVTTYTRDTGWIDLVPATGFTGLLQYRAKDGRGFIRAVLVGTCPEGATSVHSGGIPAILLPKDVNGRGMTSFKYSIPGGAYVTTAGSIGVTHTSGADRLDPQFNFSYPLD